MIATGNSQYQKLANSVLIVDLLRKGPLSRVEIASKLGLQASTVTYDTQDLLESGLVRVTGKDNGVSGKVGRKRIQVELSPDFGCVVGLELLVGFYRIVLCDILGNEIARTEVAYKNNEPKGSAELYKNRVKEALEMSSILSSDIPILGACIAISGIVDKKRCVVEDCWTHGLKHEDFTSFLSSFPFPVFFTNDADCCAENYIKTKKENFSYLLLRRHEPENLVSDKISSLGIGNGIVIKGKLYRGSHYTAGEYRSKYCFNRISQTILSNEQVALIGKDVDITRLFIRILVEDYFSYLTIMDFDRIYIGGFIAEKDCFSIAKRIFESEFLPVFSEELPNLQIIASSDSPFDPAKGATSVFLNWLFHLPQLGEKFEDSRNLDILFSNNKFKKQEVIG